MMKKFTLYLSVIIMLVFPAFGQFDILKKPIEKTKQATDQTKTNGNSNKTQNRGAILNGQKSFNKAVEAVLAKAEYNSFAEAETNAVSAVTDGDQLWLYMKFKEPLAKYVYKSDITDEEGKLKYFLYAELGALDGDETYSEDTLIFKPEELVQTELRIALAPGKAGRNKSLAMFLNAVGGGNPGVWKNEIRISNSPASPRSGEDYLARVAVTANVEKGIAKYRKMKNEYSQIVSRGTAEENSLPAPTAYDNNALKNQIFSRLKNEGITPVKFYFTTDGWQEYTDNNIKQNRKIYAAYTYKKDAECLYGIAEVVQNYNQLSGSYGATAIYLRKDSPIQCTKLN